MTASTIPAAAIYSYAQTEDSRQSVDQWRSAALCSDSLLFAGSASSPGSWCGCRRGGPGSFRARLRPGCRRLQRTFHVLPDHLEIRVRRGHQRRHELQRRNRQILGQYRKLDQLRELLLRDIRPDDRRRGGREVGEVAQTVAGSASFSIAPARSVADSSVRSRRIAARSRVPESFNRRAGAGRASGLGRIDRSARAR